MHRGDPIDLDQLEALARAATPGPWKSWIEGRDHLSGDDFVGTEGEDLYPRLTIEGEDEWNPNRHANQDFIAAANPHTILELIAKIRAGAT